MNHATTSASTNEAEPCKKKNRAIDAHQGVNRRLHLEPMSATSVLLLLLPFYIHALVFFFFPGLGRLAGKLAQFLFRK